MITDKSIRYGQHNDQEIILYIIEKDLPTPPSGSTKQLELKKLIIKSYQTMEMNHDNQA